MLNVIGFGNCSNAEYLALRDFAMERVRQLEEFGRGGDIDPSLSVARVGRLLLARGGGSVIGGLIKFEFALLIELKDAASELLIEEVVAEQLWVYPVCDAGQSATRFLNLYQASGLELMDWSMLWKSGR